MKHLKLFEDLDIINDEFLINLVKNAIRNNSTETLNFAKENGLDLEDVWGVVDLENYCEEVGNYDFKKHIEPKSYENDKVFVTELELYKKSYIFDTLDPISNLKSLEKLHLHNIEKLKTLKGIEKLTNLKQLTISSCYNLENLNGIEKLKKLDNFVMRSNFSKSKLNNIESMKYTIFRLENFYFQISHGSDIPKDLDLILKKHRNLSDTIEIYSPLNISDSSADKKLKALAYDLGKYYRNK